MILLLKRFNKKLMYRQGWEVNWHLVIGGMYRLLEIMKIPLPKDNETVQVDFKPEIKNFIKTESK